MQLEQISHRKLSVSLTPLIDVVFILLLFFMLSSNFLHWGSVELARSGSDEKSLNAPRLITVLDNQGGIEFGTEAQQVVLGSIALSDAQSALPVALQEWLANDINALYLLRAKPSVTTQALLNSLQQLKLAGVKHLSLYSAPAPIAE
ncbi:Biopolymer transport protein ExbD [Oceanospirillum multiglobuliferum]|uniref:Biopolymer transporter ExbD n=1 Tax=Oceanospirillum multiglobuliferum TaxID=64969 RepID=A0A1T4NAC1_9GAMM|nr:biopolymer transporter ExbD [Oceanospirillum multiglobuliferum]OPX55898.1 hypothetical protein BTE48_06810 [Oceanospirillum multiglobuliferum]SJZ76250.1 Biopolymer transport protein ExbD [Oceanospirillum multiglobuliferum]